MRHGSSPLSALTAEDISYDQQTGTDDQADADADDEQDLVDLELPHVPLKPFRNQVGGHSAIYKFTKRAVCKASNFYGKEKLCFFIRSYFFF